MTTTRVDPRPACFATDLVYEDMPWLAPRRYVLQENLAFDDGVIQITVPAGYRCDLASVPRLLQWIIPKHELDYAGAVHDYLYELAYDKAMADAVFYMIARSRGQVGSFRARLAWRAVRYGGWPAWWRHRRRAAEAAA